MIRPSFISQPDFELLKNKYKSEKKLTKIIKKVENNYPIQYIIGNVEFLNNKIYVGKGVLVPRFETELLVHNLIKYIKKYDMNNENYIDICTGSGCIGISLKKEFPYSNVDVVDKSLKALYYTYKNKYKNKTNITIYKRNILKNWNFKKKYSVLISNPPYVKSDEIVSENTKYEPKIALYPGIDDLIFYKKILDESQKILYKKNIIAFEIGSTQAQSICKYAKKIYPQSVISVEQDYNGYDRFVYIFNNCE